jgi:hypothetical protein
MPTEYLQDSKFCVGKTVILCVEADLGLQQREEWCFQVLNC